ncbi:hypothetical protein B0A48_12432 [Cryoendolithus antarcticus]|uniref:Uncharacterized protein n=1 Tax=Cryoendolithus antarcticus TaxID=1507870 RepID=A0A1V8SSC4_9PEZI|nr:hypothetical protein B0A48_12432 [Cryoendolithus antarcticus]
MSLSTTPLMVDYMRSSASELRTHRQSPGLHSLPERPPTPDPRQTHRWSPPRQRRELYEQSVPRQIATKHVRQRPTAIYIGSSGSSFEAPPGPPSGSAEVPLLPHAEATHIATSLRQHLPKTPSPRFPPSSPSLSSSCTTVQSSPTWTPVGVHDSAVGGFGRVCRGERVSEAWRQERELNLRRAKRLPHSDERCPWEVHAVVNVSGGGSSGSEQVPQRPSNYPDPSPGSTKYMEGAQAPLPAYPLHPRQLDYHQVLVPGVEVKPLFAHQRKRSGRAVHFQGVSSESASREDSLRTKQKEDTARYTLSKYRFPAPPGNEWYGDIGRLDSPTRAQVHYRGASFDVVNPHASLLLGPSGFETPGEIDGLLEDYFQQSSMTTPSATYYSDMSSARQNLRPTEGARDSANRHMRRELYRPDEVRPQAQSEVAPMHEERVEVTQQEEEVTSTQANIHNGDHADTREGESLNSILGLYGQMTTDTTAHRRRQGQGTDDTASTASSTSQFYEDMRTARAESPEGTPALMAYADHIARLAASRTSSNAQMASPYTRGMVRDHGTSELPTSERTYDDTNQLLNLTTQLTDPIFAPHTYAQLGAGLMRPAPKRSNTEQSMITISEEARSRRASPHYDGFEDVPLVARANPDASASSLRSTGTPLDPGRLLKFLEDIAHDPAHREPSWVTTATQGFPQLPDPPRPSEESYANTSHCGEDIRWSALSNPDAIPPVPRLPSDATIRPGDDHVSDRETADTYAILEYLLLQCKNKVLTQDLDKRLVEVSSDRTTHEQRQTDRAAVRNMKPLCVLIKEAKQNCANQGMLWLQIPNDAGLETVRRQQHEAHERAVKFIDDAYKAACAAREPVQDATDALREPVQSVFERVRKKLECSANERGEHSAIMDSVHIENDKRRLLGAATPTADTVDTADDSQLQWRDSSNTAQTLQIRRSASILNGRVGFEQDRPEHLILPVQTSAPAANTSARRNAEAVIGTELQDMSSIPRTPSRFHGAGRRFRAAISGQTAMRPLNLAGSPTSNINYAFTERDMHEASRNFHTIRSAATPQMPARSLTPRRALRYSGMALTSVGADAPTLHPPPRWFRSSYIRARQAKLSDRYYWASLTNPITCYMYSRGSLDHLMKCHCHGEDVGMAERRKRDAGQWFFVVSMLYALMFVGGVMAISFVLVKGTVAEGA